MIEKQKNLSLTLPLFLEAFPGNVYWKNLDGTYVSCNQKMTKLLGFSSSDQINGKTDKDFFWYDQISPLTEEHTEFTSEIKKINTDDNIEIYLLSENFIKNNEEKIIGILGTLTDITESKKHDLETIQKLDISKKQLEYIIDNFPEPIYWTNKNSAVIGCNKAEIDVFGLKSKEEMIGKNMFDFVRLFGWDKSIAEATIKNDQEVMQTKTAKSTEELTPDSTGKTRVFLSHKAPLYDEHKNIIGMIGTSIDITERKQLEEQLKISNHSLTLMSGSVVHELRTPLMVVNMSAQILQTALPELLSACQTSHETQTPIPEKTLSKFSKLERTIKNIQTEVNYSNTFINMLLLNLTDPKMADEKMQPCSMKKCVEIALERYPFKDDKEKVIFVGGEDFIFKGDELLTTHILFNLLKNALYYLKAANKGEITIWLESDEKENRLHFKDTAKGIPAEFLPHVFDRFYSKTQGGSGIGLAFCKMTMELFSGNISCHSVEGEYAEFVLSFPLLST